MGAFTLIAIVILAFAIGRASKPRQNIIAFEAKLERVKRFGYNMARFKVGPGLDDVLLALHRQEGIMGAVRDNMDEINMRVKSFGEQDEKAAETDA